MEFLLQPGSADPLEFLFEPDPAGICLLLKLNIMEIENFKMQVTPEQSKVVQDVCGKKTWCKYEFIYWDGDELGCGVMSQEFKKHPYPELTFEEFISTYVNPPTMAPREMLTQVSTVNHLALNPSHLSIAFRIFGPHTDVESVAKIVNIVLGNQKLFRELEKLEEKFNHPSKG